MKRDALSRKDGRRGTGANDDDDVARSVSATDGREKDRLVED